MLKTTLIKTAISISLVLSLSAVASADTKVKSRQTSGGQTYENTAYIKGKRQRSEMSNGQMIMIQQCDLRRNIQIMPQVKAYIIQRYDEPATSTAASTAPSGAPAGTVKRGGVVTSTVTTKDTGERKQMFGYTARPIITTMVMTSSPDACSQNNSKMEIDGWYIDAAFALDCDMSGAYKNYRPPTTGGCSDRYETKTIGLAKKGYPVWEKTTMFGPNGAESFSSINEVVEFSQATLEQSLFEIPEGYREVNDFASAFSANMNTGDTTSSTSSSGGMSLPANPTTPPTAPATSTVGPKREGVIRLGVAQVKTDKVAENMSATELAQAVKDTLVQQLKATNVEAVPIEATGAAIQAEAQQKQCDYVVFANVSHKKGGGGFGSMLGNTASVVGGTIGYGNTAVAVGANTTSAVAHTIKARDELILDVRLERPGSTTPKFAQQYKGKAKSAGEDIISPLTQQASQGMIAAVARP